MSRLEEIAKREAGGWALNGAGPLSVGVLLAVEERDALLAEVVRLREERDRAMTAIRDLLDSPGYEAQCEAADAARALLADIGATQ